MSEELNTTIVETYRLPSKGLIYKKEINPEVSLRSMTTVEEMKRLSHTETPYKTLCEIIDACTTSEVGISSYDMHIGDYQYLLHRMRVVTYGPEYTSNSICPICGTTNKITMNLDELKVLEFDGFKDDDIEIELPSSKEKVMLRFQTPRDLDEIAVEEREWRRKNPDSDLNIGYLLTLRHAIDSVEGKSFNAIQMDQFLRKLKLMDANYILQKAGKLNEKVGINTNVHNVCKNPMCGASYNTTFRITAEFFGPSIH